MKMQWILTYFDYPLDCPPKPGHQLFVETLEEQPRQPRTFLNHQDIIFHCRKSGNPFSHGIKKHIQWCFLGCVSYARCWHGRLYPQVWQSNCWAMWEDEEDMDDVKKKAETWHICETVPAAMVRLILDQGDQPSAVHKFYESSHVCQ